MTPEEEKEHLQVTQEIHAFAKEHVQIAREYKQEVGDPLRTIVYAVHLMTKLFIWIIGAVLGFVGLREAWEGFIVKHLK